MTAKSKNYRDAADEDDFGYAPGAAKRVKKAVVVKEASEEPLYNSEDLDEVKRGGGVAR